MYEEMAEIEHEEIRLKVLLACGKDIGSSEKDRKNQSPSSSELLFKDPSEWEHLSEEEKKDLTERMKKKFSNLPTLAGSLGNIKNG